MPTLARWQSTIVDQAGNILPGASVTVRAETGGAPLATIYSDRAGTTPIANPFTVGVDAFAAFHVVGGAYRITATLGSVTQDYRYVAIGRAAEADQVLFGVPYAFDTGTSDADPGSGKLRFNNATPASVTTLYIDIVNSLAADISAYLATWDDSGSSSDRGVIIIQSRDGTNYWMGTVTGSVVVGTNYRKISVTHLGSAGTFTAGEALGVVMIRRGTDGSISGPGTTVVGNIVLWNSTGGTVVSDSGLTVNNIATGKQTIWVPAAAMYARTTNGPGAGTAELATNKIMIKSFDFDATTQEFVQFRVGMPKSWNEGTVTFQAIWSHAATVTNFGVAWSLAGLARSDTDAQDTAFGTAVVVTDTGGTTDTEYITAESGAVTIGGTPAELDEVVFQLARVPADAGDTMTIDARLQGIRLFYTTNANTDA